MAANIQTLRFRRPENKEKTVSPAEKLKNRHAGILQDQLRRSQKGPWVPGFATAFRLILLMRAAGAMYSSIQDCDEVFNFWEPLHYLDRGYGFQTWETSPQYSIRSWAYILLHYFPTQIARTMIGVEKRPAFFAVRMFLGLISALCEAMLYRAVVEKINYRVGRYLFFMLLFSSGMWIASTAFLPSSFAMYANTLAFSWALEPPSNENIKRTMYATLAFATGGIVGWPFALAVAIPFVVEELFLHGKDTVTSANKAAWFRRRWANFVTCAAAASLLFIPVVALDTLFYGKLTVVPWNIIKYNVFPGSDRGPELYGSEPGLFYMNNLVLNFNVLVPLALCSIPALAVTYTVDRKRLGEKSRLGTTSPFRLLAFRLAPMYLWLIVLSAQPHKEERFMFPIYPLICFNASVALYLIRGWMEAGYLKVTRSPYQASKAMIFSRFTLSVVSASMIISITRIVALRQYYHAPMVMLYELETHELPRLLNTTGHIHLAAAHESDNHGHNYEEDRIDFGLLRGMDITLCLGKEWHRFPGHYLVPEGVSVEWVKSEFDGMLPGHFADTLQGGGLLERLKGTMTVPSGLNDLNKEAPGFHVDVSKCDYLIDVDFPVHPRWTELEPRYAADSRWERVVCESFLDGKHSSLLSRALWMPGDRWQRANEFGEYCLLRHKENVARKEREFAVARPNRQS